ncbi:MAG: exodeoxyribonuclease III [Bacteroidales bacterium]|nr:exodeoxyribonuclease III [Bacteroidales bacterium]
MKQSLRIISWNVNGIRAMVGKGFYDMMKKLDADIICIQETKADEKVVRDVAANLEGYKFLASSAVKKGYSGTAVFTRPEPVKHYIKTGKEEHDQEGRMITVEYDKFYLVNLYVPNSGQDLKRLDYRREWDLHMQQYIKGLIKDKPVILTGDLNVAHEPVDLARPKENYNKSAGYTQVEIDGFKNYLEAGFTDVYRERYPDKIQYTFWNQRFRARERNVGWRIDYFLVSREIADKVKDTNILDDIMGSDHCPVSLEIAL